MIRLLLIIAAQLIAFWPVWRWFALRVSSGGEDAWGLLPLACAAFFLWRQKPPAEERDPRLALPAALVLVYAATYAFLPPIARAALAFTALGCTLSSLRFGKRFHLGTLGLLCLSLPLIPSLQFYVGYPLRAFVTGATTQLLRFGGFAVIQEGTCLNWAGQLIWVDAPCSGIRMLWVGLFTFCFLSCVYELRPCRFLLTLTAGFVIILIGNVMRAVALFYVETGTITAPSWAHDYVGVVSFAVVASLILITVRRMGRLIDAT